MNNPVYAAERNARYFAKHGYGSGCVGGCSLDVIRSLTVDQLNELIELILRGDVWEVPLDADTIGVCTKHVPKDGKRMDPEEEFAYQLIAALVYLSGHLAEDFPALRPHE